MFPVLGGFVLGRALGRFGLHFKKVKADSRRRIDGSHHGLSHGFGGHDAGMALQAYLPDSYHILKDITTWARKRVAAGGSPVKIRIVKGANMEMELVESAFLDWPLAPFDSKIETDANWKRMVSFGMQPENIKAVRLGIASHNLFDLAYA